MNVDTNNLVSIADASRDFSKVTRMVDESGAVIIIKNDSPCYLIKQFGEEDSRCLAREEDVIAISELLLKQNREAYEVLAK